MMGDVSHLSEEKKQQSERTQNIVLVLELIISLGVTFVTGYFAKDMVLRKLESIDQ